MLSANAFKTENVFFLYLVWDAKGNTKVPQQKLTSLPHNLVL